MTTEMKFAVICIILTTIRGSYQQFIGIVDYGQSYDDDDDHHSPTEPPINVVPTHTPDLSSAADPLSLCGDWHHLGLKCYKIANVMTTKSDASLQCHTLDRTSHLMKITSITEQDQIIQMLKNYKLQVVPLVHGSKKLVSNSTVVSNVWLGIKYHGSRRRGQYRWDDESELDHTNWDEDSPDISGTSNLCVQMNLDSGKWSDVKCGRKNLVVCEKNFELTVNTVYKALQNTFLNFTARLAEQDRINDKLQSEIGHLKRKSTESHNSVPIGFTYIQFPNQSSPIEIWPELEWKEVTDQYPNLLFRSEGNDFHKPIVQTESPQISNTTDYGLNLNESAVESDPQSVSIKYNLKEEQLIDPRLKSASILLNKIWKRIQ